MFTDYQLKCVPEDQLSEEAKNEIEKNKENEKMENGENL